MRVALFVLVVSSFGCAPMAGDSCAPVGGGACDASGIGVLICNSDGRFVGYGCPGPGGCATRPRTDEKLGGFICDTTGTPEGAACPSGFTGLGYCSNPKRFVTCDGQAWTGRACSSCTTAGGAATCKP